MKKFHQFIIEATAASIQAKRLGLVGDSHGGWYNRATGEFEAKTVGGKLKYYNKRQIIGGKDPKQTEFEKNIPLGSAYPITQPEQVPTNIQPQEVAIQQDPIDQTPINPNLPIVQKTKGSLTIVFGRFNPPTIAHQELMDNAALLASQDGSDYVIVPSRRQDKKKNPLDPDTKISFMKKMFPEHSKKIINDQNYQTIFDVLKQAHNDGYSTIKIVCGADRAKEFEKLSNSYNGQLYQFDIIEVLPLSNIDPDGNKSVEGISSSRLRLAAAEGDFITFRTALPETLTNKKAIELFDKVRVGMEIGEIQKEGYKSWEIAPKLNEDQLRENYINKNIFDTDTIVENLNTGMVGKIIRRGTNYLICVTEDGMMFKSWIKDLMEH